MKCPFCSENDDRVVDSRESRGGATIRRRRECLSCSKRFTSYEQIEDIPFMVVKDDGSREEMRIPAEIWRRNSARISKLIMSKKTIEKIILDPHLETADTNLDDNFYPRRIKETRVKLKTRKDESNPMRDAIEAAEKAAKDATETAAKDGATGS